MIYEYWIYPYILNAIFCVIRKIYQGQCMQNIIPLQNHDYYLWRGCKFFLEINELNLEFYQNS